MKLVLLSAMAAGAECFLPSPTLVQGKGIPALRAQRNVRASEVCMSMESQATRREVLALSLASAVAAAIPSKADAAGLAFGYSENLKDMNTQLEAYGLSKVASVPGGFKPLMQTIGGSVAANIDGSKIMDSIGSKVSVGLKSGERVLVLFNYPGSWIVSLPISTTNGESGTVSAGNYVKGDSAAVSATILESGKIVEQGTEFFEKLLTQTVSNNGWQGFKVIKKKASEPIDGNEAVDIEYRYDLITSGPVVGRHGFAKLVGLGTTVVALGATSADTRFKNLKDDLKTTTDSFRVHIVKQEFEKAR
ncbi:hypothetical protein GUITHDRAFT_113828 [Guillardia theta CCMP2712]|uniref:PsbP C-terminal domain-containing protein n=2 Tax=Guillardia theta TaxID=55529 RepID=L1IV03_GUITC|nr:hypothetical protein GUITHDRAFT_113828 [Guillardia theta CCMP2712]EKX40091.1 hypothetical protein GUITHDRAFT_113828 [Guillardia theta CCMP2712]|eukprot:XP_005827071.1 hypothetical protein GUITHDRAFT_113828 [Guillardia theta CCMP2712]